jgi:hypothetical protein
MSLAAVRRWSRVSGRQGQQWRRMQGAASRRVTRVCQTRTTADGMVDKLYWPTSEKRWRILTCILTIWTVVTIERMQQGVIKSTVCEAKGRLRPNRIQRAGVQLSTHAQY